MILIFKIVINKTFFRKWGKQAFIRAYKMDFLLDFALLEPQ